MGLADLKKKPISIDPTIEKTISIEEFISDAEHYAMGGNQINKEMVSSPPIHECIKQKMPTEQLGPYRHATFSFTEAAIAQLTALANEQNIAKSKLLRQLITKEYLTQEKLNN